MGSFLFNFLLVVERLSLRWDFCRFFKVLLEQLLKFLLIIWIAIFGLELEEKRNIERF